MTDYISRSADIIAMFCRLQMNGKKNIPVRSSEMGVLIFTQRQDGPVTPLMVSSFFRISKPSATAMINSLVRQEYLLKIASPTDGRSCTISLTDKGIQLVENTSGEYYRSIKRLEEKMGHQAFEQFIAFMSQANTILGEEGGHE